VLVDKVADKLPGWKGKLLNKVGRLALVNSVLSSVVIYHITVFPLSKWAIKKIDRIRHNFLWQGAEEPRRGHYLVNWRRVQQPKKIGAWAYLIRNVLTGHCDFSGSGNDGRMIRSHGPTWHWHTLPPNKSCSGYAPP
jgi:hypothetical protein